MHNSLNPWQHGTFSLHPPEALWVLCGFTITPQIEVRQKIKILQNWQNTVIFFWGGGAQCQKTTALVSSARNTHLAVLI